MFTSHATSTKRQTACCLGWSVENGACKAKRTALIASALHAGRSGAPREPGSAKGLTLYLANDFDAPLAEITDASR